MCATHTHIYTIRGTIVYYTHTYTQTHAYILQDIFYKNPYHQKDRRILGKKSVEMYLLGL